MISLVIFDCDGVLVDSEPISCRVMAEALTAEGLKTTTQDVMRDFMGRAWADSLRMIEARLGRPARPGFTEDFRAARDAALAAEVRPVEGVRKALEEIESAGMERCVASSGAVEKIRLTLGATELLELFEGRIFSATRVSKGKPAPDLFLLAAREMNRTPEQCAVIEDTPVGIEAARAAGMTALAYADNAPRHALETAGAHVVFDDMGELRAHIAACDGAANGVSSHGR
jgi:HAD superfamily hydrolase (TIGR01509 family)